MDESGHDHRQMPFEARGGIVLPVSRLWRFVQSWEELEENCFGLSLKEFNKEAKGSKLLDRDRFKWAGQGETLADADRKRLCRSFLEKGVQKSKPSRDEFFAYGQASLQMASGIFDLLRAHDAKLFASLIPRAVRKPKNFTNEEFLRKDHVFLFERFFYFLNASDAHGLVVMDQTEKTNDRMFVSCMSAYFRKTYTGRTRSGRIVPAPIFVDSEMSYPVQAADMCLYCINWGYRRGKWGEFGPGYNVREEIALNFGRRVADMQWKGDVKNGRGKKFTSEGIFLVKDPYESRG